MGKRRVGLVMLMAFCPNRDREGAAWPGVVLDRFLTVAVRLTRDAPILTNRTSDCGLEISADG